MPYLRFNAHAILILVTIAAAATGYLRELLIAKLYGTGAIIDAFYLSFGFVQTIHDLLFAGSLTAAVVPLLHRNSTSQEVDPSSRARFVVAMTLLVAVISLTLTVMIWVLMPNIVGCLAPAMSDTQTINTIEFGRILILLLPANALITLFTLALNAQRRFILPALVYLTNNLAFLAVLSALAERSDYWLLPEATLVGPLLGLPAMALALVRLRLLRMVRPDLGCRFFEAFWRLSKPLIVSAGLGGTTGLLMLSHLIVRSFGAKYPEGAIASLSYAFRLYEVPLSLVANPASTIIFPTVAALFASHKTDDIRSLSRRILISGLLILFPAAVVVWIGSDPIVTILLYRGNFDTHAVRTTSEALRGFAPAIVFEAAFVVLFRFFYALHRPGVTVAAAVITVCTLQFTLSIMSNRGLTAIALSLSAAFAVTTFVLIFFLVRILGWRALPRAADLLRWAACASISTAFALLATQVQATLFTLVVFSVTYIVAVLLLLPERRAALATALQVRVEQPRT